MGNLLYFERLVASAERIVHHAHYPGKREAVEQCMEDVEDLARVGRISSGQCAILREILLGARAVLV